MTHKNDNFWTTYLSPWWSRTPFGQCAEFRDISDWDFCFDSSLKIWKSDLWKPQKNLRSSYFWLSLSSPFDLTQNSELVSWLWGVMWWNCRARLMFRTEGYSDLRLSDNRQFSWNSVICVRLRIYQKLSSLPDKHFSIYGFSGRFRQFLSVFDKGFLRPLCLRNKA